LLLFCAGITLSGLDLGVLAAGAGELLFGVAVELGAGDFLTEGVETFLSAGEADFCSGSFFVPGLGTEADFFAATAFFSFSSDLEEVEEKLFDDEVFASADAAAPPKNCINANPQNTATSNFFIPRQDAKI
ncbi:MAG: hypothetical protein LUD39_03845, partial [Opitutae bacterium]|nr:hypothetical protein [Opitutae bacterium]